MSTNTQTCNKCRENKPLNMFHRKGTGHQKTCKQCRLPEIKEYTEKRSAGTLIRRKTSPIQTENFIALQERIVALEPRLRAKAAAFSTDAQDADDIYSLMIEAILTKSKPEESDFFLLQRANWTAKQYIEKNNTYSRYVDNIDIEENEATQAGFKIVTNPRAIEDAMIQNEEMTILKAVIESLPKENRNIVALLSIGKDVKQVSAELKISQCLVKIRIKQILKILEPLELSLA